MNSPVTTEQYLEFERSTETRNEFRDGVIVEVSGGGLRHIQVVGNVTGSLHQQLKGVSWEVFAFSMRIGTPDRRWYLYPDVVISEFPPHCEDSERDTLLNPRLILEVLSPTTEAYDRGAKFAHYRSIPTLAAYVLVAQDRIHVEHYQRQDRGGWLMTELDDLDKTLELASVGCRLRLADVYDRVFAA